MSDLELMQAAVSAREGAYAPYSNFRVGAALLGKSGKTYTGCNVENASYSVSNCAERTALFKAVSEGEREFVAIVIAGGRYENTDLLCAPCGVCRQALAEFCGGELRVILQGEKGLRTYTLGELLPLAFGKENLK